MQPAPRPSFPSVAIEQPFPLGSLRPSMRLALVDLLAGPAGFRPNSRIYRAAFPESRASIQPTTAAALVRRGFVETKNLRGWNGLNLPHLHLTEAGERVARQLQQAAPDGELLP